MSDSLVQSFHRHLQARGLAPSTQERYVACVLRLVAFARVEAAALTSQHAYDHLVDQSTRLGLSASWYNVQFVAIVRWFEFRQQALELRGLLPQRRPLGLPRALSLGEVGRLFAAMPDTRYQLACQLAFATGMRISELVHLRVQDIDPVRPLIRIERQKGGDGRYVLLSPSLRERLRAHWKRWRPQEFFFVRRLGDPRPILAESLRQAFNAARERAGLGEGVTVHSLRHTFATHALRAGVDVVTLPRLLGHRCIQSTVRYLTPDLGRADPVELDLLALLEAPPRAAAGPAAATRTTAQAGSRP